MKIVGSHEAFANEEAGLETQSASDTAVAERDTTMLRLQESLLAERVRVEEAAGKQPEAPPPRRTGVLGLWDDLTAVDSEAGAKAAAAEEEARAAVAAAKERHLKISDRIHVEAEAFHTSTNEDFAAGARPRMAPLHSPRLHSPRLTPRIPTHPPGIRQHIEGQLAFEEAQQRHWRKVLETFEEVESAPRATPRISE